MERNRELEWRFWRDLLCVESPKEYQNLSKICCSGSRYAHQNLREKNQNPWLGQSADYAHYQELAAKAKAHVDHGTAIQTDVLHQAKASGSEGGEMEPPPSHRTRSKAEGKKRARA